MNELVEANLKFVVAVCRNYQYQGLPMVDLISEGNLGLIRAAQRFDASLNFKFISYAVWWIRQAILTALAEQSRPLNISAGRVTMMRRIGKVSRKLEQKLGRQPRLGEVAEEMGKSEKEITECVQLAASPLSLTSPAPGDSDSNLMDSIKDENAQESDAGARQFLLSENMNDALSSLDEREERVLRMYYGLGGKTAYTLEEIASHFEVTRERIRQIKAKALLNLRHPSRIRRIRRIPELMTEFSFSNTTLDDSLSAGEFLGRDLVAKLGGKPPDMVLVFSSSRFHSQSLLSALTEFGQCSLVVGCTCAGEFVPGAVGMGLITAMAIRSSEMRFSIGLGRNIDGNPEGAVDELIAGLKFGGDYSFPFRTLLVLTDALAGMPRK